MKKLWYTFIKSYIKIGLFFYTKEIKIIGKENIPKKGAVLFAVNHPNGLLDPLLVTTNTARNTHYLVRAAIFKKTFVKKFLATLNLMPIYRIRDGVKELSKNADVFNECYDILNKQQALMIFPEGSHDKKRTIRELSKGFTRIIFGSLDAYPDLKITVIPVGVTYQNASQYPCKVAIHFGKPIDVNNIYNPKELNSSVNNLKIAVSNQLKELTVHIPLNEEYETTLNKLNINNVDFTDVKTINNQIKTENFTHHNATFNLVKPVYFLMIINSIIPWVLWKLISKKIDETEFVDTFRFGIGISIFPVFYTIQTFVVYLFLDLKAALLYAVLTLFTAILYAKFSTTRAV